MRTTTTPLHSFVPLVFAAIAPLAAATAPPVASSTSLDAESPARLSSTIMDARPLHLVCLINASDPGRRVSHEVLAEILGRLASTDTGEVATYSFGSSLRAVSRQPLARGAPAADPVLRVRARPAPDPVGVLRAGYGTAISLAAPGHGRAALLVLSTRVFRSRAKGLRTKTFEDLITEAGVNRPGRLSLPVFWLDLREDDAPVTESRVGPVLVYSGGAGSPDGRALGARVADLLAATPPLIPEAEPPTAPTTAPLEGGLDADENGVLSMALSYAAFAAVLVALAVAGALVRRQLLRRPAATAVDPTGEPLPESAPPDLELRPLPELPPKGLVLLPSDGGRERRFPFPTAAPSYTVSLPGLELPLPNVGEKVATLTLSASRRADLAVTGEGVRLNDHPLRRVETTLKDGQLLELAGNLFTVSFFT